MIEWANWVFAAASGFAAAGFLATLHHCMTGSPASFHVASGSPMRSMWNFLICMFAGPYIVAQAALRHWRAGQLTGAVLAVAAILVSVWSMCAGVVVAQLWWVTGAIAT